MLQRYSHLANTLATDLLAAQRASGSPGEQRESSLFTQETNLKWIKVMVLDSSLLSIYVTLNLNHILNLKAMKMGYEDGIEKQSICSPSLSLLIVD